MIRPQYVAVKTITDYHLEAFIKCPYRFYYQHILSVKANEIKWKQVVQSITNKIVQTFFRLPHKEQDTNVLLHLIERYWKKVSLELFETKIQYYLVLAKTTNHLLQYVLVDKKQDTPTPPLFLYQKLNVYMRELETELSVMFDIAEWSTQSFTVKKFLVEADEDLVRLYQHLIIVFSEKAFGKLPERIEITTLLDGKQYIYSPIKRDLEQGLAYLSYIKSIVEHPNRYEKTTSLEDCYSCPFTEQCQEEQASYNEMTNANMLH